MLPQGLQLPENNKHLCINHLIVRWMSPLFVLACAILPAFCMGHVGCVCLAACSCAETADDISANGPSLLCLHISMRQSKQKRGG